MELTRLARPFSSLFGFALLLAVNATSVWGGVFPFLPAAFQTTGVTVSFFVAQTIASALAFACAVACSFAAPGPTARALPWCGVPPMLVGSCALIAAMYVDAAAPVLVVVAGALSGAGSTCMMLLWQKVVARRDADHGTMLVIAGTGLSAVMYFALCLCPLSVTAFLVPLVLLPLCGTALALALRPAQAQGEAGAEPDVSADAGEAPSVRRRVCAAIVRDYWRSALAVGALGFVAGVIRAIALGSEEVDSVVNVTSMVGALVSSVVLIVLWRATSFLFSPARAFVGVFPVLILALGLLPFLTQAYLDVFAGFVYMLYAFAQMILLVQCAQAARDRGTDPVVVFGLCGGLATLLQCLGLICGWATGAAGLGRGPDELSMALTAILCMWALGMALYLCQLRRRADRPAEADAVEFISLAPDPRPLPVPARGSGPRATTRAGVEVAGEGRHVQDRISKQCESLRLHFRLSGRETQVMERIVRGDTVARIAADLEISENTVRTHAKRIYAKLGVHSKSELSDLLAQFEPASMPPRA